MKVLLFIESESEAALVLRRKPAGGFAEEFYSGREAVIELTEIEASLPLAEVYERIAFPETA